jgi:hypothetical protein
MISLGKRPREGFSSSTPGALGYTPGHASGPRGVPYGSNIPVQNISSQIHTQTNTTASVPLLVRPWRDGTHLSFFPGDILFVEQLSRGVLNKVVGMSNLHSIENLDISKFEFFGVYRNETNVQGVQGQINPQTKKQQMLINVDVFGRSRIANIFGNVSQGDHVGLALCKTTDAEHGRSHTYMPTVNGKIPKNIKDTISGNVDLGAVSVDEITSTIPIGVVSFTSKRVGESTICKSLLDRDNMVKLPQIEILIL